MLRYLLCLLLVTTACAGPERWEAEVAAFEKETPRPGGILFTGSSSIRLWKSLVQDFPGHQVIGRGIGGSQIPDHIFYVDRVIIPQAPRQIVFYCGGNDINARRTPENVAADTKTLVEAVRAKLPEVQWLIIGIAANPARWKSREQILAANALVAEYCRSMPGMQFLDVFPHMLGGDGQPRSELFVADRLHMNAEGYRLWTGLVTPLLME